MNNVHSRYPWLIISSVIFVCVLACSVLYYSFNLGHKMTIKYATLVDAMMEAKLEVTTGHLWAMEIITGESAYDMEVVTKHFNQANWYLNAIINGGKNKEGHFYPLEKEEVTIRTKIKESIQYQQVFSEIFVKRLINVKNNQTDELDDEAIDENFINLLKTIDDAEDLLQQRIAQEMEHYLWIRDVLIIATILINLLIIFSFQYVLKFEQEWFLKYFNVKHKKDELEKANNIIDKYIPISKTDLAGNITSVNTAMSTLTGYSKKELMGKNHRILKHPDTAPQTYVELWDTISNGRVWEGEIKGKSKTGQIFWGSAHIHPLKDEKGQIQGYQAVREDITTNKELEYLSEKDSLTGIYNRRKFDQFFEHEMTQYKRYKTTYSLAIFDLDYFKKINDNFGHQVGDEVLIESVNIFQGLIRQSDVLSRWGGEEFTLLLTRTSRKKAKTIVEKIRLAFEQHQFKGVGQVTISCGISQIEEDDSIDSLLKRVDDALYQAKENGRNCVVEG